MIAETGWRKIVIGCDALDRQAKLARKTRISRQRHLEGLKDAQDMVRGQIFLQMETSMRGIFNQ